MVLGYLKIALFLFCFCLIGVRSLKADSNRFYVKDAEERSKPGLLVKIDSWKSIGDQIVDPTDFPRMWKSGDFHPLGRSDGLKGTYQADIYGLSPGIPIVIYTRRSLLAAHFFVNGEQIFRKGQWSDSGTQLLGQRKGRTYIEYVPKTNQMSLVIQLHSEARLKNSPPKIEILSKQAGEAKNTFGAVIDISVLSITLVIGLYHFCLYVFMPKAKATLYFALFCFCFFLRAGSRGEFRPLFIVFDELTLAGQTRMEFIYIYASGILLSLYCKDRFPNHIPRHLIWATAIICGTPMISLFMSIDAMAVTLKIFRYVVALTIVPAFLFYLIKIFFAKRGEALSLVVGVIAIVVASLFDVIKYAYGMDVISVSVFGVLGFIIAQAIGLSRSFSKAFKRLEHSEKKNLKLIAELRANAQEIAEKKILESNISKAQKMWSGLLVDDVDVTGYDVQHYSQMAEKSGGDWVGVNYSPDLERCILLIGDVSGHGSSSALVTLAAAGAARGVMESLKDAKNIQHEAYLETLVGAMNRAVLDTGKSIDRHMTMAAVYIDTSTGDCTYINAGHTAVYLKTGGQVKTIFAPGSILGMSESPNFGMHQFTLAAKSQIFMFTDGLLENRNKIGKTISERKVRNLLENSQSASDTRQTFVELASDCLTDDQLDDVSFIICSNTNQKAVA
ncbi:MAG: serine/threonine-protein phosphatase [Pseudobacteriovorax sp.]|nr:serine/threonine-protein phosphatase [Pseudobacteriovorax sp.]